MPNWCSNTVIVEGEVDDIHRFINYVRGVINYVEDSSNESPFSFQAILPMPRELVHTRSPVSIVSQNEYTAWASTADFNPHYLDNPVITQEMSDTLKDLHGTDNWYDWRVSNWGTKWDADEVQEVFDLTHVQYKFDTAWGPPNGIYEELVNKFPTLSINWFYEEENMDVVGNLATDDPTNKHSVKEVNNRIADLLGRIKD